MNWRNASRLIGGLALLSMCLTGRVQANASTMTMTGVYYDGQWFPLSSWEVASSRGSAGSVRGEFVNSLFTWRGSLADGSGFKGVAGSILPSAEYTVWRRVEIVFKGGAAPRQFTSDLDIFSAAAKGLIALRLSDDVYHGVLVGAEPSPRPERNSFGVETTSASPVLSASIFPNPLNPLAKLAFTTSLWGPARVTVYGVNGNRLRTLLDSPRVGPGRHVVEIDGRGGHGAKLSSGIYYYRIETSEGEAQGRFTVLK